jgi:transcriptional regulator with XRE-family HTH domain
MSYATEDIIKALKHARQAKGLSQRALSSLIGVPQSHISKIESGGTDIRLSSLIELARVLDLELKLVPRKAVPAIETVVRSTNPPLALTQPADNARAVREFDQTLKAAKDLRVRFPDLTALKQIQDNLQSIKNIQSALREPAFLARLNNSYEPLRTQLEQIRKVADSLKTLPPHTPRSLAQVAERVKALPPDTLSALTQSANHLKALPPDTLSALTRAADTFQQVRNQIAHGLPAAASPRPAYQLDDDESNTHG